MRRVDEERAHGRPRHRLEPVVERAEPAEPLGVGHRGVRRRGRREDEERGVVELARLRAELGALAEDAAVGLLADEGDRVRPELVGQLLEPAGVEVAAPEVARARRRAVRGVGHAEPELEQLELLLGLEEPRREAGVVEQAPEVVARVREVGVRGRRDPAGVDAAEDAAEVRARGRRERRYETESATRPTAWHTRGPGRGAHPRARKRDPRAAHGRAEPSGGGTSSCGRSGSGGFPPFARRRRASCSARLGHRLALLARLDPEEGDGLLAAPAVAAGVALGFRERPEPHGGHCRTGSGRTSYSGLASHGPPRGRADPRRHDRGGPRPLPRAERPAGLLRRAGRHAGAGLGARGGLGLPARGERERRRQVPDLDGDRRRDRLGARGGLRPARRADRRGHLRREHDVAQLRALAHGVAGLGRRATRSS